MCSLSAAAALIHSVLETDSTQFVLKVQSTNLLSNCSVSACLKPAPNNLDHVLWSISRQTHRLLLVTVSGL